MRHGHQGASRAREKAAAAAASVTAAAEEEAVAEERAVVAKAAVEEELAGVLAQRTRIWSRHCMCRSDPRQR